MELRTQHKEQIEELRAQSARNDERWVDLEEGLKKHIKNAKLLPPSIADNGEIALHKNHHDVQRELQVSIKAKLVARGEISPLDSDQKLRGMIVVAKKKALATHPDLKKAEEEKKTAEDRLPAAREALRLCTEALNAREPEAQNAAKAAQAAREGSD